jgi:hypothetical protein
VLCVVHPALWNTVFFFIWCFVKAIVNNESSQQKLIQMPHCLGPDMLEVRQKLSVPNLYICAQNSKNDPVYLSGSRDASRSPNGKVFHSSDARCHASIRQNMAAAGYPRKPGCHCRYDRGETVG